MVQQEEEPINLRQLGYFAQVVEAGNMTAAAERLKVAQPALGVQIRQLERELGVTLLTRHSRGVTPTAAGRLLRERAARILADVEAARRDVVAVAAEREDRLTLGVIPSIMLLLGPTLLIDARKDLPHVRFSLIEERSGVLLEAMERGQLDVALAWDATEKPDRQRVALIEADLLLVTAPDGTVGDGAVSFAEALSHDLAIAGARGVIRRVVEAEARRLALKMKLAFELHSVSAMKALVARGEAATIMPYSLAAPELASGALVGRRIDRPALALTLYAIRPTSAPIFTREAAIQTFLDGVVARALAAMGPHARSLR